MKKTIAIIQIITILFWHGWNLRPLFADDSDIFGTNIAPNVMILFDSSGSMSNTIFSHPYVPLSTYNTPLTYSTTKVYRKYTTRSACNPLPRPCYKVYKDTVAEVPNPDARDALHKDPPVATTTGFWNGTISGSSVNLVYGNYLNYLACSSCSIQEQKIVIAKRVVNNIINNTQGVRFGVMKFANNSSPGTGGGGMVATLGTDKATMTAAVNGITPSGYTPLGEQLDDAGRYYKGQTLRNGNTYTTPIQYSCQPNFVILMTDGLQNGSVDVRTEATNRFSTPIISDHSATFSGTQNVIVHTVGFAITDADERDAANDVLQTTANNGGGSFFYSSDSAQLETALQNAISQILAATFSFATPVVPTTGTAGNTRAYLASFQSNPTRPSWKGFLKAYNRDANGLIPVDAQGLPSGTPAWDAGNRLSLKAASDRNIKTYVGGSLQDFKTTTSAITTTLLGVDNAPFPLGASSASGARDKVINFTRGTPDTNDEDIDGIFTEERPWKLGDIFHSTPVLVTPPFLPIADSSYSTFKTAQTNRATILLAGANDGMLHAFTESDGEESWAFIPPDLLDDLKDLTPVSGNHDYFVDSSPIVADVKTGGNWKTIAVFGERRGGNNYYALDITNTTNPQYQWSFTDANLGETWSEPAIGKVKMADGTDKWVAFVGAGFDSTFANYNSGNKKSEGFFVIDLSNGAKLWEYYNATGSTDDRQYMNFGIPASPTAVDLNNDGYIDRVYIGDVGGQLWKFDLSAPATVSAGLVTNWTGKRLFSAASSQANPPTAGEYYPAQAIFTSPALAYDGYNNLWVFFGTGDRYHPNNTASNRFYGIKENTTMTNGSTLTESSLTNLTSGSGSVTQGWYIVLNSNEKVLAAADVFNSAVLFTTFTPTTVAVCGGGGGDAKLYAVNMTTGDAAFNLSTGATLPSGQAALAAAKSIGTGIPSRPVVIMSQSGNRATPYVITGTTNQQISTTQGPQFTIRRLVGWREVF